MVWEVSKHYIVGLLDSFLVNTEYSIMTGKQCLPPSKLTVSLAWLATGH